MKPERPNDGIYRFDLSRDCYIRVVLSISKGMEGFPVYRVDERGQRETALSPEEAMPWMQLAMAHSVGAFVDRMLELLTARQRATDAQIQTLQAMAERIEKLGKKQRKGTK